MNASAFRQFYDYHFTENARYGTTPCSSRRARPAVWPTRFKPKHTEVVVCNMSR